MDASMRVKKMFDEVKALKQAQPLNGGDLTQHSITRTWTGQIDFNNPISIYSLLAAFRATYTRTDGVNKPPLAQFSYSLSPDSSDSQGSGGGVYSFGDNSVSYRICLLRSWWHWTDTSTPKTVTLTCSVYSPVPGNLTIERVYS